MTRTDRCMVAGAWALLAFCVALGTWKISSAPEVEPWVIEVERRWELERRGGHLPPPNPVTVCERPGPITAGHRSADAFAATIVPTLVYVVEPLPRVTVEVLPTAAHPMASADHGGALLQWELEDVLTPLPRNAKRVSSKPASIRIERASAGEPRREIATVDPKATRHLDLTAEPNRAYRYWVVVVGPEIEMDGRAGVRRVPEVLKEPDGFADARTPPAHRVGIIGGDVRVAILRVERYDRALKTWVPRVANVKPGEKIGTSGWTLDDLRTVPGRFGTPALVADVTDETGARKTLRREE